VRLPATSARLLRQRRDAATHLPAISDARDRQIAVLQQKIAALEELVDEFRGEWKEALEDEVGRVDLEWRREVLLLNQEELKLRWELMLRVEMTYE